MAGQDGQDETAFPGGGRTLRHQRGFTPCAVRPGRIEWCVDARIDKFQRGALRLLDGSLERTNAQVYRGDVDGSAWVTWQV